MNEAHEDIATAVKSFLAKGPAVEPLVCIELNHDSGPLLDVSRELKNPPSYEVQGVVQRIETCATVCIESSDEDENRHVGLVTLVLRQTNDWTVVSIVVTDWNPCPRIRPTTFETVAKLCWAYCEANRACDGELMSQVFHSHCRLVYSKYCKDIPIDNPNKQDDDIVVLSQKNFCEMVTNRYSLSPHNSYVHLKDDPRVSQHDCLRSIEFCNSTNTLALVKLKVGHPPMLWTDLLVCGIVEDRWWILHKSSSSEDLLKDEGK